MRSASLDAALSVPIFDGGANQGNLDAAKAAKNINVLSMSVPSSRPSARYPTVWPRATVAAAEHDEACRGYASLSMYHCSDQ